MKTKLRVLEVITTRFASNGITAYVLSQAEKTDDGIQMDYIAINEPGEALRRRAEQTGGRVIVLSGRNTSPLSYMAKLKETVKKGEYDIVHVHGNSCTMYADLSAARRGGAKIRIAHAHNTSCRQKFLHRLLRRPFQKNCTAGAACGTEAGRFLFGDRRFTVLKNGIDTERFRFSPAARKRVRSELDAGDAKVLLCVGNFNEQKNQNFLIAPFCEALKKDPGLLLVFVGEGERMSAVRAEVRRRGLESSVRFLGRREDVESLLSAADAFLMPSLFEGFPIAAVEAQCAGLPCVLSDTVTKDADIIGGASFVPLKAAAWRDAMLRAEPRENDDRADAAELIRRAGYDRTDTAAALAGYYRHLAVRSGKCQS